jgi:hypothetical protein
MLNQLTLVIESNTVYSPSINISGFDWQITIMSATGKHKFSKDIHFLRPLNTKLDSAL